jgi:hypothetical protein
MVVSAVTAPAGILVVRAGTTTTARRFPELALRASGTGRAQRHTPSADLDR